LIVINYGTLKYINIEYFYKKKNNIKTKLLKREFKEEATNSLRESNVKETPEERKERLKNETSEVKSKREQIEKAVDELFKKGIEVV
jgi:hypothetical protein